MPLRRIPSSQPPFEADLDTLEMIEAGIAAERNEQGILVLTEVIEIGMRPKGQEGGLVGEFSPRQLKIFTRESRTMWQTERLDHHMTGCWR